MMTQIRLFINIITFKHFLLAYDVSRYVEKSYFKKYLSSDLSKFNINNAARGSLLLL